MTSVGILTFHHTGNYGAWLQARALAALLEAPDRQAEIIDYRPWRVELKHRLNGLTSTRAFRWHLRTQPIGRRSLTDGLATLGAEYRGISRLNRRLRECGSIRARPVYRAAGLPRATAPHGVLITGSDEVWKLKGERARDWSYFLDFAAPNIRLLSYAASCGDRQRFGDLAGKAKACFSRFHALSVRDQHTARILREELGIESSLVVDPAWFLDLRLAEPARPLEEPYVLLLGKLPEATLAPIQSFASGEGLRLVSVGTFSGRADRLVVAPDPMRWLALIRDAAFVFTTLYHGTIFAFRYRRPFLTLGSADKRFKLEELMQLLGLERRLVFGNAEPPAVERIKDPVDFERVETVIEPRLVESRRWLLAHL